MKNDRKTFELIEPEKWLYLKRRYDLTPRECQIAELICQGEKNGNIAKILRIKPGTAKTHIRNSYRKMHINSKIEILLRFIQDSNHTST